jgi:hypothetical protein
MTSGGTTPTTPTTTPGNSSRPLLLVDVDGVLNCFGSFWTPEYEAEHFEPLSMNGHYTIRIPRGTRHRLAQLTKRFDPVWATAWLEDAHPFFQGPLQLGDPWPVIRWSGWDGRLHKGRSWKWSFVDRFLDNSGGPAAWIDDDLHPIDFEWAARRTDRGAPTLLVKTNPCHGLTDEHVAELLVFERSLS